MLFFFKPNLWRGKHLLKQTFSCWIHGRWVAGRDPHLTLIQPSNHRINEGEMLPLPGQLEILWRRSWRQSCSGAHTTGIRHTSLAGSSSHMRRHWSCSGILSQKGERVPPKWKHIGSLSKEKKKSPKTKSMNAATCRLIIRSTGDCENRRVHSKHGLLQANHID